MMEITKKNVKNVYVNKKMAFFILNSLVFNLNSLFFIIYPHGPVM